MQSLRISDLFGLGPVGVLISILALINIGEHWRVLAIFVIFADLLGTP